MREVRVIGLGALIVFAVLLPLPLFAEYPEVQPPPAPYTDAKESAKPAAPPSAIYSPTCGQRTKGCLKPGTYQLPYGTLTIHRRK